MRRLLTLIVLLLFVGGVVFAQQDAMYTKYIFNAFAYNPAYAGAKDHMSISLLHRTQWWNIEGAPNTQSFTVHTPLKNNRVGVGLNIVNDKIGPTSTTGANIAYAYRIPLGENGGKISIGLQGGVENFKADWTELNFSDNGPDAAYDENVNMWLPNFGAGIYYYSKHFYVGFAVPHLVEYSLRDEEQVNTAMWARQYRHYYFSVGGAIPLSGDDLIFKPSFLIKNVGLDKGLSKDEAFQNIGAPTEFDVDLSVLFYETFWLGLSFRSSIEVFTNDSSSYDSVDIWASYMMSNGFRIGAAFDYSLTKLQTVAGGSFEVMLGYEFNYVTKKTVTPRYF